MAGRSNMDQTTIYHKEKGELHINTIDVEAFFKKNKSKGYSLKDMRPKKKEDPNFSGNWYLQLDWIYKKSPNYEKSHLRYPIIRVGG